MTRETLTLASSSPRRRQLLEMLGIPVRVVSPNLPEIRRPVETPMDYVERLAREKALSVPGSLVLGADTTVVVRDEVLEKPLDQFGCREPGLAVETDAERDVGEIHVFGELADRLIVECGRVGVHIDARILGALWGDSLDVQA